MNKSLKLLTISSLKASGINNGPVTLNSFNFLAWFAWEKESVIKVCLSFWLQISLKLLLTDLANSEQI